MVKVNKNSFSSNNLHPSSHLQFNKIIIIMKFKAKFLFNFYLALFYFDLFPTFPLI